MRSSTTVAGDAVGIAIEIVIKILKMMRFFAMVGCLEREKRNLDLFKLDTRLKVRFFGGW